MAVNKDTYRFEKMILGDSAKHIVEGAVRLEPKISEYLFTREVLGILQNPFNHEALVRYLPYVGELTKPLHVFENNSPDKTLFTVPPFMMPPHTGMVTKGGMTADLFYKAHQREADIGIPIDAKVAEYMMQITGRPDVIEFFVKPVAQILGRYGLTFNIPEAQTASAPVSLTTQSASNGILDGYDD